MSWWRSLVPVRFAPDGEARSRPGVTVAGDPTLQSDTGQNYYMSRAVLRHGCRIMETALTVLLRALKRWHGSCTNTATGSASTCILDTPASVPIPGPTPAGPVDLGNAEAISQIMKALESMGLPDLLSQQIRSSIPPAPATKTKDLSNEQRLAKLGSKISILEQQSTKLTKNMNRLQEDYLETRKKLLEKTAELESAKTEYRMEMMMMISMSLMTLRRQRKGSTWVRLVGPMTPIPDGAEAGDMDVSGSAPIQTRATGGLGKRRCLEFVAPPIDLLSAGFGQYSEADCNVLMDRMKRLLEELEDARGSEVLLDPMLRWILRCSVGNDSASES